MKIRRPGLVLAVLTLLSACNSTPLASGQEEQLAVRDDSNSERIICKSRVKTGTRIGTRTCMTSRVWKQRQEDAREATEQIQRESVHQQTISPN